MPKYLVEVSYTAEGAKGLIKAGGSARRVAVQKMVESLGGRLEAFFFTFGENDMLVILDLPENLTAATLSLAVMSTGVANSGKPESGVSRPDLRLLILPRSRMCNGFPFIAPTTAECYRPATTRSLAGIRTSFHLSASGTCEPPKSWRFRTSFTPGGWGK
jgi:uncharacterized protein with GYD domain